MKKKTIIFIVCGVLAVIAINVVGVIFAKGRFLKAILIFMAVSLPLLVSIRLLTATIMALKEHKKKNDKDIV